MGGPACVAGRRGRERRRTEALPADPTLPADAEFTDPATAAGAYARAELAVAGLVAAYGRDQVWDWAADWAASGVTDAAVTALLRRERARRGWGSQASTGACPLTRARNSRVPATILWASESRVATW